MFLRELAPIDSPEYTKKSRWPISPEIPINSLTSASGRCSIVSGDKKKIINIYGSRFRIDYPIDQTYIACVFFVNTGIIRCSGPNKVIKFTLIARFDRYFLNLGLVRT